QDLTNARNHCIFSSDGVFGNHRMFRQLPAQAYNFRPTLFLTSSPGAPIVLRYVATHSPESFAESRFCLRRPTLLVVAVHERLLEPTVADTEGDRHAGCTTKEKDFLHSVDRADHTSYRGTNYRYRSVV